MDSVMDVVVAALGRGRSAFLDDPQGFLATAGSVTAEDVREMIDLLRDRPDGDHFPPAPPTPPSHPGETDLEVARRYLVNYVDDLLPSGDDPADTPGQHALSGREADLASSVDVFGDPDGDGAPGGPGQDHQEGETPPVSVQDGNGAPTVDFVGGSAGGGSGGGTHGGAPSHDAAPDDDHPAHDPLTTADDVFAGPVGELDTSGGAGHEAAARDDVVDDHLDDAADPVDAHL